MTLTNYWWLLIWVFIGGFFLSQFPKKKEFICGKEVKSWNMSAAMLLACPYVIWTGFRGNLADTKLYRIGFLDASTNVLDIPSLFLNSDIKDPGYEAFVILMRSLIGDNADLFFLIIALFQVLCIVAIFRKYSVNYWLSFFLFIASTDYMSWMMNGMRQFIAVTAILACFTLMLYKKYIPLLIAIIVTSTFHESALLMIPIVFIVQGEAWNKKTIMMIIATLIVITWIEQFTPIMSDLLQDTQYDRAFSEAVLASDDGTNVLRVLVYSVPALLSLVGLKYIRAANNPVVNMCVNCSIVTMALYLVSMVTSGIYMGRLPIYTTLQGYIVVPWLIDNIFTKESARIIRLLLVAMFCVFFYYQMFIAWNY